MYLKTTKTPSILIMYYRLEKHHYTIIHCKLIQI